MASLPFTSSTQAGTGQKFGRNYLLSVQTQSGDTLTVKPPFTIEFDITRNVLSSANIASIRVYNLKKDSRNKIRKNVTDYGDLRLISLKAGYGTNLSVIFAGSVTQCWSVREGVNMITQIESLDGGFAFVNGVTNEQFTNNTDQSTIIKTMLDNLDQVGVSAGAVGNFPGLLARGNSYSGNTTDLIRQLTNGNFFIDNNNAFALNSNEYIIGPTTTISSASGLLNTPTIEQTIVHFDMLFEPSLYVGQLANLQSITDLAYNGPAKVISLKHRGMISEAVCGDAVTSVGLFYGVPNLTGVAKIVS